VSDPETPPRVFCVVLMTGSECDNYPGITCVMNAFGPYPTREKAKEAAGEWPEWTAPHIMELEARL
jgi:hypothetical protein